MILAATPEFAPLASSSDLPALDGDVARAGSVARDYLTRVRGAARARHDAGERGLAVVAAYTDAIDRLVRFLFDEATVAFQARSPRINQRCTLIAQGGYGRGELNPYSDIDILILYPWKVNPYVETVAEVMLIALWDAGLEVGSALRNTRECARMAARDLKVMTALLDARYLCGDEGLFGDYETQVREELRSRSHAAFFKDKLAESAQRHRRAGESIYLLQPQVKEGQGGLRDLHTALWMANVKFKVRRMRDLVPIGVLAERDIAELEVALDFLFRVRNGMHLAASAHQDQLTFELQERLAPALGFGGERAGEEAFMRAYYGHASTVNRIAETIVARCVAQGAPYTGRPPTVRTIGRGMRIQGRTLSVTGREVLVRDPAMAVRIFVEAQRHGVTLSTSTRELIRESLPALGAVHDRPEVGQAFLDVLRAPGHVYETLLEMHGLGVLAHAIPEFAHLTCLIAHDPFHTFTVDYHSLMGVRELERLRAGEFAAELPHLTQVVREVPQPELLFLGMLFHDIGKGEGHDHDRRGAEMTRAITGRLGLNVDESAACEFLVQHHLLMSHLAQRRDIHDDELVTEFCRTVGTVENLQRLYVLTFADMRAVGPKVWNNWRDSLLRELFMRARECFDTGSFEPEDRAARAARIRTRVVEASAPGLRECVGAFVETMPESYLLSTPEALIVAHGDLRRKFGEREAAGDRPPLATEVAHAPDRGSSEFAVCTRDRPGLFAMLTGVLASHGLNILAARISTSTDGVALDSFRLQNPAGDASIDPERWERVQDTLRRVLAGGVDVEDLVRRSQRPSFGRPPRRVATTVEIDNAVSQRYTVLDVYARDRVGLLFTITNCLYHLWVDIHLAKITTMVDQVLDVFYVTDNEGRKIEDPERLEQVRDQLLQALADDTPAVRAAVGAVGA
ncbi:MAG: [protein-PII] uridylyltransferase [Candidatus Binatia bacterium]